MKDPVPDVVYWFAETEEPPPRYVVRGVPGTPGHLTDDPLKATRFASKFDCLAICCGTYASVQGWKLVPREHMFFGPPAAASARCTPPCTGPGPDAADRGPDPEDAVPLPCPTCGRKG